MVPSRIVFRGMPNILSGVFFSKIVSAYYSFYKKTPKTDVCQGPKYTSAKFLYI